MSNFLYLSKITLVSIWFRIILTQIITWRYKGSLTLIPIKYQSLIGIVGSLTPLFLLIIETMHSTVYRSNTGLNWCWIIIIIIS
jgi:hypothetical protein